MSGPLEIAYDGSDYEVAVRCHGDGSIEINTQLVLSETGREPLHFPRLTPEEARTLAKMLEAATDAQDRR